MVLFLDIIFSLMPRQLNSAESGEQNCFNGRAREGRQPSIKKLRPHKDIFVSHYPPNSGGIASLVAELNAALCLVIL